MGRWAVVLLLAQAGSPRPTVRFEHRPRVGGEGAGVSRHTVLTERPDWCRGSESANTPQVAVALCSLRGGGGGWCPRQTVCKLSAGLPVTLF